MKKIINRKVYDTKTAEEIATNDFSDGSNRLNVGRSSTLYRTTQGSYFAEHETCWQGEHDTIEPLSEDEAIKMYEQMHDQKEEFESAFPDVEIQEA